MPPLSLLRPPASGVRPTARTVPPTATAQPRSARGGAAPARRPVAARAAHPHQRSSERGPLAVAAPQPADPPSTFYLEPLLRSFLLGVSAGALFEAVNVGMKVRTGVAGKALGFASENDAARARRDRGRGANRARPPAPRAIRTPPSLPTRTG